MNKFNLDSMRSIGIILLICFIFLMVISKAFDFYIPPEGNNVTIVESTSTSQDDDSEEINTDESNNNIEEDIVDTNDNIDEDSIIEPPISPVIIENNTNETITVKEDAELSPLEQMLEEAKNNKSSKNYDKAIENYKTALTLTQDTDIMAYCYENISLILASQKRYGSALSAIQKSFNLSPNTQRELLIARLYYKVGNIEQSHERIKNILKRDITLDDK